MKGLIQDGGQGDKINEGRGGSVQDGGMGGIS